MPKANRKKASKSPTLRKEDLPDFRMYRDEYPKIDDLVLAEVTRIEDTGVYLKLVEYKNLEGLMMLSELSKRRWRNVSKLVQVHRKEIVMVMRVDRDKGYVDLSKKRVPPAERESFMERYKNSNRVHSIFRQVCARSGSSLEQAYERFGWRLYEDFPHAIDGLELLAENSGSFYEKYDVPLEIRPYLEEITSRRLTKKTKKVRAIFEINCFTFDGVESIKKALMAGEALSTEEMPVKIRLISSPTYSMIALAKDPERGIELVEKVCEVVEAAIRPLKGTMVVKESAVIEEDISSEEYEDYDEEEDEGE